MLPNSATRKRTIYVAAGASHSRSINALCDQDNMPIVERMARSRLDKMSPSQVAKWRNESIKAIQDLSPRKSERDGVITQYFERRHTHEAPSPLNKGSSSGASPGTSEEPSSTPGKWHGKKKTDSARKRVQARSKAAASRASPSKFMLPSPDRDVSYIA